MANTDFGTANTLVAQSATNRFFWYVAAMALVAFIASIWMPDTGSESDLEEMGEAGYELNNCYK